MTYNRALTSVLQVSDIEALLAGESVTDQTRENMLGTATSQACSIQ